MKLVMPNEFAGSDLEWIAADAPGHVAVFTVAGGGPMPAVYRSWPILDQVSKILRGLPVCTTAEMRVAMPRPDDYLMFAERGLFTYDWTDFHRTAADAINCYELMSRPTVPAAFALLALPPDVRSIVPTLCHATFGSDAHIRVVDGW